MSDPVIGWLFFTDGTEREVFLDAAGRQYVRRDDGAPVYGVWLPKGDGADEPLVIEARQ